jgi:hypothetical protein
MSSHALDNQMDERIFKELEELKKQLRDIRTTQAQGADAVNLTITGVYTVEFELLADQGAVPYFTLENEDGRSLFSVFEYDVCIGSWSEANVLKNPANNLADIWEVKHHTSYAFSNAAGSKVQERFTVRNFSGATNTVIIKGRWRYLVSSGSGSTI